MMNYRLEKRGREKRGLVHRHFRLYLYPLFDMKGGSKGEKICSKTGACPCFSSFFDPFLTFTMQINKRLPLFTLQAGLYLVIFCCPILIITLFVFRLFDNMWLAGSMTLLCSLLLIWTLRLSMYIRSILKRIGTIARDGSNANYETISNADLIYMYIIIDHYKKISPDNIILELNKRGLIDTSNTINQDKSFMKDCGYVFHDNSRVMQFHNYMFIEPGILFPKSRIIKFDNIVRFEIVMKMNLEDIKKKKAIYIEYVVKNGTKKLFIASENIDELSDTFKKHVIKTDE